MKWYCCIYDGVNKVYEGINQSQRIAKHMAAINFMKDLIHRNGEYDQEWRTQLGLPDDVLRCEKILDDKYKEYEIKSQEIEEIGSKNPISFLNEL